MIPAASLTSSTYHRTTPRKTLKKLKIAKSKGILSPPNPSNARTQQHTILQLPADCGLFSILKETYHLSPAWENTQIQYSKKVSLNTNHIAFLLSQSKPSWTVCKLGTICTSFLLSSLKTLYVKWKTPCLVWGRQKTSHYFIDCCLEVFHTSTIPILPSSMLDGKLLINIWRRGYLVSLSYH